MARRIRAPRHRLRNAAPVLPRLQIYVSQSLSELAERLVECSREEKGQSLTSKTRDIVYVLKTYKLRHASNAHAFRGTNGVGALLSLLSLCSGREGRDRGLLLSTLGNLCALDKDTRTQVINSGLTEVVSVLQQSGSLETLCTVSRLLANLAMDRENIPLLQQEGVVRELCHALLFQVASDSNSKQSILRALRLLCASSGCREEVKCCDGLPGIIDCLKSGVEEVAVSALKTLEAILHDRDPDVIQALASSAGLPHVVLLCQHSEAEVATMAVDVLVACAKCLEGRVALSSAGGVECLLQHLERCSPSSQLFPSVVGALCACCRDVLGRQRLRDSGGLERLIHMLSDPALAPLHEDILAALVCYYFDELSLKLMVKKLGLLRALTYHLQQMTARSRSLREGGGREKEGKVGEKGSMEELQEARAATCEADLFPLQMSESSPSPYPSAPTPQELSPMASCSSGDTSVMEGTPPSTLSCDRANREAQEEEEEEEEKEGKKEEEEEEREGAESNQGSQCFLSTTRHSPSPVSSYHSHSSTSHNSYPSSSQPSPHQCPSPSSSSPSSHTSPSYPSSPSPSPQDETPPPSKRPRLSCDLEFSRPMPANFIDSLLSSPNPYQTQSKPPDLPLVPDLSSSLENQVIQLISRVSHLRDCLCHLASRDLLLALLDCFLSSSSAPNTHIFKTLSRVFANPHCFQDCVACLTPSKLYQQLYCCGSNASWSLDSSPLPCDELEATPPSQTLLSPPYVMQGSTSRRFSTPLSSAPPRCTSLSFMCKELLSRLSRVGESPYGQGVLAHMLLAREEREKEATSLTVPLLCRAPRVCQRIMLDYKGLDVLVDLTHSPSTDLQDMASDSLLALASTVDHIGQRRQQRSMSRETSQDGQLTPCREPVQPLVPFPFHTEHGQGSSVCRYRDSDHCPFDFTVAVSKDGCTSHLQLHRTVLMEASEVFRVMLGGHYLESSYNEVFLRDVHPLAFQSVLHHMYGCGWLCRSVVEEVTREGEEGEREEVTHSCMEESNDHSQETQATSELTDSTIADISVYFDLPRERAAVTHTLRTLATASRFLLHDLCGQCEGQAASYLSPVNVVAMFTFSQLHQSCWLAEQCVRCVVGLPPSLQRRACLQRLLSSPEGPTALDMIQRFISTRLVPHTP